MPSGYTQILEEKDVTLEEFVNRVIGAFVCDFRDDPIGKHANKVVPSYYHQNELTDCLAKLMKLESLTENEWRDEYAQYLDDNSKRESSINNEIEIKQTRANNLLNAIEKWQVPTPDHVGIKNYMKEQVQSFIRHDCQSKFMKIFWILFFCSACQSSNDVCHDLDQNDRMDCVQRGGYPERIHNGYQYINNPTWVCMNAKKREAWK